MWWGVAFVAAGVVGASAGAPPSPQTETDSSARRSCRVEGHITSGRDALPGVSVIAHADAAGDILKAATSTDTDGNFSILFAPNATYRLTAELTAFSSTERTLTLGAPPCDTSVDFQLSLRPRRGNDGRAGQGQRGFQTLEVQADANGEASLGNNPQDEAAEAARLLPAGFSLQNTQADAVAISGSNDATSLDRGLLNDRVQAIALGQFDPATGQFAQGFGPQAGQAFGGDLGGPGAAGQFAGRGGGPGGGRGGFLLGGRAARGQGPYQDGDVYVRRIGAQHAPYQINPQCRRHSPICFKHIRRHVRRPLPGFRASTKTRAGERTSS